MKYVNDTFGHISGDKYLKNVVSAIKSSFIYNVSICRIGGDEFSILSEKINANQVDEKLRQINKKLSNDPCEFDMSVSFGSVDVTDFGIPYQDLIKKADDKMYAFKASYKN